MSKLLARPTAKTGRLHHITPASAGWRYVGFDLYRLSPGEAAGEKTRDREVCLVFVSGKASLTADGRDLGEIGHRMSPFSGKPDAVYVPAGSDWSLTATTPCEIAVGSAPGKPHSHPVRIIGPADVSQETRGHGTNTRYVTNILPESEPADSLLVVEVITPGGHTSSYPPHKHDTDNLPAESLLEETYYHRLDPPQGFAFQRIYTDDRSLDEAVVIEDADLTMVPKGYHPCAACHGYDLYYLNVMAGPVRTWKFHNAREHEWILSAP
ncbi:MAG: 5-deoxy-glucuronate isomerase [Bauldia sp.]